MILHAATIALSAFLLFLVQPIIARQILPWFGGSAAVWTTCMVFFQVALLAGYFYSDLVIRKLSPRVEMGILRFHATQQALLGHLTDYPSVAHDDQADSLAGAVQMIADTGRLAHG